MSKTIAVWGSPGSGKTTFSVKLASAIYENYQSTVIVVFCDLQTPTIPVIFPTMKDEDAASLGAVLAKIDITTNDTVKNMVTVKDKANLGFFGYCDGENLYSYPKYEEEKVRDFFKVLSELADFVIIDCAANLSNSLISNIAVQEADEVFRLASPDLKSISFYLSQLPLYTDSGYKLSRHKQGINISNADVALPVEETKTHLKEVSFVVPFSRAVKEQSQKGTLYLPCKDARYNRKMKKIAEALIGKPSSGRKSGKRR